MALFCSLERQEKSCLVFWRYTMRQIILLASLLLAQVSHAQEYVLNGDFEEYTALPTDNSQLDNCTYWFNPNSAGPFDPKATPDYLHIMGGGLSNIPNHPLGIVNPQSGIATTGIVLYSEGNDYREYICTQLKNKLIKGKQYTLIFHITDGKQFPSAEANRVACDGVQAAFSATKPEQNVYATLPLAPSYSIGNMFFSESWVRITHTFVAKGDEQFLTMGNFKSLSSTNVSLAYISSNPSALVLPPRSYIFIDSVSLRPAKVPLTSPKLQHIVCQGQSATLVVQGEKNLSWYQMPQDSLIAQGDSVLTVSPTKNTQYRVVGNSDTLTFSVNVQSPPSISYSDTTTCQPLSLVLGKTTSYDSLQVSPKTDSLRYTGTYLLTAYQNGCTTQRSILYTREDCKEDTLRFNICEGDKLILQSKTFALHTWYLQTTSLQTSTDKELQVQPSSSTYYRVKGFSDYRLFEVIVRPKPVVQFQDVVLCAPIKWALPMVSDMFLVNGLKIDSILQPGLYTFVVQKQGCTSSKTISVQEKDCKEDTVGVLPLLFKIPSAFSPNGDGINDVWEIRGIQQYPNAIMSVYNRWGNIVHTSNFGYPVPWDGTRNGYPITVGTYYYILELKNQEAETKSGSITIIY
jgi:gliding motility-associated-like protein